jgi:hypothetical protein
LVRRIIIIGNIVIICYFCYFSRKGVGSFQNGVFSKKEESGKDGFWKTVLRFL